MRSRPGSRCSRPSSARSRTARAARGDAPNPPHPDAPDGETDAEAVVLREVGERPSFGFELRDHLDLARALGLIETEKAAEASGSRFAYLLGDLVLVELALIRFAVEAVGEQGFTPVIPPVLVREDPLFGTGFFPGEREMIYEVPKDELFLVGTSEVSLAALHAEEILEPRPAAALRRDLDLLPARGRCCRQGHPRDLPGAPVRQGRDVLFVDPERADDEHQRLLAIEEQILAGLEIPYRVVDIPVGDLGAPGGPQVRLRGLDPEPGALPRADLDLEHDRLPGAAHRLSLPAEPGAPRPSRSTH